MITSKGFDKNRSIDTGGSTATFKNRLDRELNRFTIPQKSIAAIYTDGSGTQEAQSGFGTCFLFTDGSTYEIGGFERNSTNQRAELRALIEALQLIKDRPERETIEIYSDSAYVCDGYNNQWVAVWQRCGWKNSEGNPVKNRDLWEQLEQYRSVAKIHHLRGHSDRGGKDGANRRATNTERYGDRASQHNKGNCRADAIAGYCRINLASLSRDGVSLDLPWQPPEPKLQSTKTVEEWTIDDLKSSGISDEMIALNVQAIEGDEAVQILAEHEIALNQSVQYVTRSAQSVLRRYDNATHGVWVAWGSTIDGDRADPAYVKPRVFRHDFSKGNPKPIKYETPGKCEALPILPFVTVAIAEKIFEKYGVTPLEGESFWRTVKRCNLPVFVTEGLKKAVLLTQQGYPAIALRGVANWHSKGSTELFPILQEFATKGRKIFIVFDQDEKPKTIANVGCQIRELGKTLQNLGCKVFVTTWSSASGKGIDDGFVKEGAEWLDDTIAASLTLDEWQKCGLRRQYFEIIRRLKTLLIKALRETTGDFLPELPFEIPIGSIIAIAANMGSGKTTRINADLIQNWKRNGGRVLILSMLNSLGKQIAKNANVPHISDYGDGRYADFLRDINEANGAALCVDSLRRIPEWFLTEKPILLVLDEVNQFLDHMIRGETLGSKHGEILDRFSEICFLCNISGAIVVSEANIHPRSVELLKQFSGCDNVRYYRHSRQNVGYKVTIGSGGLSGFINKILLDAIDGEGYSDESKRFMIPTDSQASGKKIERRLMREFPNKRIVRIDSETNRQGKFRGFFEDPNAWLERIQPDFLIVSPSIKTGVSITWEGFDAVYGFFVGEVDPDGWAQMLGRYRPTVPRFVCCPKFVATSGDESLMFPRAIDRKLTQDKQAFSAHYAIEALSEIDDRKAAVLTAAQAYYSEMCALRGAQKAIARDYLISVLQEEGHTVEIEEWGVCSDETGILAEIQDEIDQEDAAKFAASPTCDTIEDAKKILASDCSLADEIKAKKTLHCQDFPNINFDDSDDCYWILTRKRGKLGRGAQMQAAIENILAIKELDRESVEAICSDELGMAHRLSKRYPRAQLLKQSGILQLADRGVEFSNSDPRCIAIQQFAVKYAKQFRYYFGLTIAPEYTDSQGRRRHTAIDICGKLLKLIGLTIKANRTQGKRGSQERIYSVHIDRVKEELQDAAWKYRDKALTAARERLNLIAPIELPESQSEPESPFRTEEKQIARIESEQDFETPYSQDFRRRSA